MSLPKKFLIIKPSSLGDIIHTLPMVAAIKKKYPQSHITWVVTRGFEKILEKNPCIDDIKIFERKQWGIKNFLWNLGDIFEFFQSIRKAKFDCVLDFQGLLRTAIISWASGSSQRIGFANAREFAPLSYTTRVVIPNEPLHAIDRYKLLLKPINIDIKNIAIVYPLQISEEQRQIREDLPNNAKIAIIPGARWETKMWPTEHFAKLINILAKEHQVASVLLGGKDDTPLAQQIKAHVEQENFLVDLVGKTSIKQSAAVLQEMKIVVGNDTGPMHLAVAMGIPVLGLFGPTDPKKVGPYGKKNEAIWKNLCHAKCKKRYCAYERSERRKCLHSITPEEVVKKLKNMGLE